MPAAILTIVACLHGADCRMLQPAQDAMSLTECMATSQASAATWAAAHPEWRVTGVQCSGVRVEPMVDDHARD